MVLLNRMKKENITKVSRSNWCFTLTIVLSANQTILCIAMQYRLNSEVNNIHDLFFCFFVVGGLICVIGQIIFDVFKLTPGHVLRSPVQLFSE